MEKILDLKKHLNLLPQYVELRNNYCELLLTQSVGLAESMRWIKDTTTEIRAIEEGNLISGVGFLNIDRGGEVSFFARRRNRGIGTRLLKVIDDVAKQVKLPLIWAWVREDNRVAAKVFEKCGYCASGCEERIYKGKPVRGARYTKVFLEKI